MLVFAIILIIASVAAVLVCITASPLFRTIARAIDSCAEGSEER